MSRIGKQPITIPEKVDISSEKNVVTVKGPLGELQLNVRDVVSIQEEEGNILVTPKKSAPEARAFWGLYRALIANMVHGVSEGFEKRLEIEGVGYRAEEKGNKLVLNVGYSHPIELDIPEGLTVKVEKNTVIISGADKQLVGQFAANVRAVRKPEPYKGKGIRYADEHIRRKAGKRAIGGAGAA